MTAPLISIVMPVYNRASTVAAAIASIPGDRASGVSMELIVVDDGSRDGSAAAAEAALAATGLLGQVLRQANGGPGAARNAGARAARGRWLAFMDSDDRWRPWTLRLLAEALQGAPSPALLFLQTVDVRDPDAPLPPQAGPSTLTVERHRRFLSATAALRRAPRQIRFASCNAVIDRAAFLRLGGFPETIRCSEDTDLFLRADGAMPCLLIRAPEMVAYVRGGDSLSGDVDAVLGGLAHLMRSDVAGRYGRDAEGVRLRRRFLAQASVYAARIAFARGRPGAAYGVLARRAALMARGGEARWLWRLALTPLLSALRPDAYPFAWSATVRDA